MGFMDSIKKVKELQNELYPVDTSHIDGTFYYDESNNFRKFRLVETGFNNDINNQSCFCLGGLYVPKNIEPNVDDLIIKLRPQKKQKEFKFKFFSYGNPELRDFLKSKRLKILFEWIKNNDLLIHMSTLDYLFYSIVDIVDNLPDVKITGVFNRPMKDILYEVVRLNVEGFTEILYKYKYPNLTKETIFDFYEEVYNFYLSYFEYDNFDPNDFPKELLRQMLKSGFSRDGNGFLEDNEDYLLYEHFEMIYLTSPINFPNGKHIFDEEPDIIEKLKKLESDYERLFNMRFDKSDNNIFIQLSDSITGFSAKLDTMIFNNNFEGITNFVKSLDDFQLNLVYDYMRLIVKSDNFCILFTHATVPEIYRSKYSHLLQEVVMAVQNDR